MIKTISGVTLLLIVGFICHKIALKLGKREEDNGN